MKASDRGALALAGAAFGLAAPLAYQAQRVYEVWRAPAPTDPTMIIAEAHTALYWRLGTATWWAGLAALAMFTWARRREASPSVASRLGWLVLPAIGLLLALAFRLP